MDTHCPHCANELNFRYVRSAKRNNAVVAGNAALSCPQCGGGLKLNLHPTEGDLPFGLTGELAVFVIALVAWLLAQLFLPLLPAGPTAVTIFIVGILGLIGHQLYFYKVTLASWPRYKPCSQKHL